MKYIVANFKQNLNLADLKTYLTNFVTNYSPPPEKQVIFAGSFIHLPVLAQNKINFQVGAQNISRYPSGAHTGQTGVEQLGGLVDYCLVGHSEVRRDLADTDQSVAQKVKLLQKYQIKPIICLDKPYLETQIQTLKTELLNLKDLIFAYEPISAIGTFKPDTPGSANETAYKIKNLTLSSFPVLYGGSVSADNVHEFTSQEYVDGVLVGSASLDPTNFISLIDHV